ncbi:MAG TPA: Gfo/Idh/MocA family oxidoreductase [Symbiobacteriaceae bacterium]|nr:Gfo/Idh/MocA family oxidoreductase [Symbiobacteriaceae bacterium]
MTERKLRVGIAGPGWAAGEHIKVFQASPHTEVVALFGNTIERCLQRKAEYGLNANCYTDYEQMLTQENLDIVSICTPNHLHAREAILAAEAGCHLLIEKPVVTRPEDLYPVARAIDKAGVKSLVGFVLHWNPMFQMIRSLLDRGAVGDLFAAEVDYLHGLAPGKTPGFYWYSKVEGGGSSLLAAGCHAVDGLRYFMRKEAVEVQAYSTGRDKHFEYDPTIMLQLRFADGSIGKVHSSLEVKMPYKFSVKLFGTEGTVSDNEIYAPNFFPGQKDWAAIPTVTPNSGDVTHHPYRGEVNHFIQCVVEGRDTDLDIHDAVKTHEIIFAAEESARTGKPVSLPVR